MTNLIGGIISGVMLGFIIVEEVYDITNLISLRDQCEQSITRSQQCKMVFIPETE